MSATRLERILIGVRDTMNKDLPNCTVANTMHNDWPGGKSIRLTTRDKSIANKQIHFEIFEAPTCCAIIVLAVLTTDLDEKMAIKVLKSVESECVNQGYSQIVYNEANAHQDKILNASGYRCRAPFKSARTGSVIRTWLKMLV